MSHTVCAAAPCARPFVRAASLRSAAARPLVQRVRSDGGQPATSPAANAATTVTVDTLFSNLDIDLDNYRRAPATLVRETASIMIMGRGVSCLPRDGGSACHLPHAPCRAACFPAGVQKQEVSGDVLATVEKLANAGALKKWGAALSDLPERRSVMLGELRLVGVKQPEKIAQLSVRNDAGGDGRGSIERGSSSSRIRACWHWVQHMYLAPPTSVCSLPVQRGRHHQRGRRRPRPAAGRLGLLQQLPHRRHLPGCAGDWLHQPRHPTVCH